jgi:hypothetical protein
MLVEIANEHAAAAFSGPADGGGRAIEIRLPNGIVIGVSNAIEVEPLRRVLAALGAMITPPAGTWVACRGLHRHAQGLRWAAHARSGEAAARSVRRPDLRVRGRRGY